MIETHALSLAYGDNKVLDEISLTIRAQRITAIVGPSGCGKTSFLMALNRLHELVANCRVTGDIRYQDRSIFAPDVSLNTLRRDIATIFQQPTPFPLSIANNITLPLKEHGFKHDQEERMERVLRQVGLWNEVKDRLNTSAEALSGGQQQRLCLARALVLEPKILLLDEPCSALDPIASGVIEDHLSALRKTHTIVLVTHNLAQARRLADDVAVFWVRDGCGYLAETGVAEEIFEQPKSAVAAAYIEGRAG